MAETVPPFNPKGARYDQSTFEGRLRHFREMTDPNTLLVGDDELKKAQSLLAAYDKGDRSASDAELWNAKRIKDAIIRTRAAFRDRQHGKQNSTRPAMIYQPVADAVSRARASAVRGVHRPGDGRGDVPAWAHVGLRAGQHHPDRGHAARQDAHADDLLAVDEPERQCHVQLRQPERRDRRHAAGRSGVCACGRRLVLDRRRRAQAR